MNRAPRIALILAGVLLAARAEARSFELGVLAGTTAPDAHLADYQWDVTPHPAYGALARVRVGAFAAGVRGWQSQSEQAIEAAGASPRVHTMRLEGTLAWRAFRAAGAALELRGAAGTQELRWTPGSVTLDTGAPGGTTVALAPLHTPVYGAGAALVQALPAGWRAEAGVERRWYALDTAHRSGAEVIDAHEGFADWSAQLGLTHEFRW